MSRLPLVLTLEAAAERLLTTPDHVSAEIEAGRLDGFRLGDQWRTTEPALLKFMGIAPTYQGGAIARIPERSGFDVAAAVATLEWSNIDAFTYHWQEEGVLTYDEGREAKLRLGNREIPLLIGFRTQEFAGDKNRQRAIVFMGRPPSLIVLVEFAGEDSSNFATTGRLASIIKYPGGKHVRPGDLIPTEYANLPTDLYTNLVTGPYAARSMAIVVHKSDYNLMAHHALIRAHSKGLV